MKHSCNYYFRTEENALIRRDLIFGARRSGNYFFGRFLFIGGLRFLLTGLFSWKQKSFVSFLDISEIPFLPKGLVMCFYGILGFRLSLYLLLRWIWSIGRGFNEYIVKIKQIHIFRWGFPGKSRRFEFFYSFFDIESIRFENSNTSDLYLLLKDQRPIPLIQAGSTEVRSLQEIEYFAATLAKFLDVSLEEKTLFYYFKNTKYFKLYNLSCCL